MKFRTSFPADTKKFVSESGSKFLDQYSYDFDEKGDVKRTTLHKTDNPINVYDRIQADYSSTDINLLMKRFALGDTQAINVKDGIYADVTNAPTSMADLFNKVNACKSEFDALPVEVKQLFDNSYEEFWSEYGTDEYFDKIDQYNDQFTDHSFEVAADDVRKENVVDEQE